jgi:hypothetical protein
VMRSQWHCGPLKWNEKSRFWSGAFVCQISGWVQIYWRHAGWCAVFLIDSEVCPDHLSVAAVNLREAAV